MPVFLYHINSASAQAASDKPPIEQISALITTPLSAGYLKSTPTSPPPTATATPTFIPTATPTATPLPAKLIQATAWQATLDQAAEFSHATQTQAAGQYAATQTALPPILTANAIERATSDP